MSTSSTTPVAVPGLTNVTAISAAPGIQAWTTCALRSDGTVWCWGGNNGGTIGNGTMNNAPSPVQLAGISTATSIYVGTNGACAVLADESLECWGQVGLATNTLSPAVVLP
jgi:alpha-tubulin suppressor-like RCC1 family protein